MDIDFNEIIDRLEKKTEGDIKFYSFSPEKYSNSGKALKKSMPVFYNPVQELNRSISLIAFRAFNEISSEKALFKPFYILDSMAASGIRSLRILRFLDQKINLLINDLNPLALEIIHHNASLNNIDLSSRCQIFNNDANFLFNLLRQKKIYPAIIDIDPFGSPNIFIENALRSISRNGILGVTATDTAVFFGIRAKACKRKYNTTPLRSSFLKEMGLRLLLYYYAIRAHPLGKAIKPLLSLSFDHYVRHFIQIKPGQKRIDKNLQNIGYVIWCPKCYWRTSVSLNIKDIHQECPICSSSVKYGGPFWIGPLHDKNFIHHCQQIAVNATDSQIPSKDKIIKVLNLVENEDDFPIGNYDIHGLCDLMTVSVSSMADIFQKIKNQGYDVIRTHINPLAIKSDIPLENLKQILRDLADKQ